jgi:hypothetical protein
MGEKIIDSSKLTVFLDLMRIVERAYVHKLKTRRPDITDEEVALEVKRWYMDRPGAEHGDSDGVIGDISRFTT